MAERGELLPADGRTDRVRQGDTGSAQPDHRAGSGGRRRRRPGQPSRICAFLRGELVRPVSLRQPVLGGSSEHARRAAHSELWRGTGRPPDGQWRARGRGLLAREPQSHDSHPLVVPRPDPQRADRHRRRRRQAHLAQAAPEEAGGRDRPEHARGDAEEGGDERG